MSGAENHCTLPGCDSVSIKVTKPVVVTVKSQMEQPYANLAVYAFSGTNYTGNSGTTDAQGRVTLTLPQGNYRFRADYDGVQFWCSEGDACQIAGCDTAAVTLPGGSGQAQVNITYTYDALRCMTDATYSNGTNFHYAYDAAGSVLAYTNTIGGQTKTNRYTYDAANQLLTAQEGAGTVWHSSYDGNGSLVLNTPGEAVVSEANRYAYNSAGALVKVETYDGANWQAQAEMSYDGMGNRLAMTGPADGQSVTTTYALDNGQTLLATAGEKTTAYLYGNGAIGELTETWAYTLADGTNTPRQMADEDR